ncbi:homeobox protein MOX-1 isoform X1 [Anolis sagrei]|uniref:homeobox protein MOX-1 isoform X1 n=1 Tax=Anolis sagrei TaxID=38937 RepID=UPI00351FE17C
MDPPAAGSCMRSSHPTATFWGCLRNPHAEVGGTAGLHHYSQPPFSFHHKPDLGGYTDFSTSCLAAAPQSHPRDERAFVDQHHLSFQNPAWHFTALEGRRRLPTELAQGTGEPESGSPNVVDTAISTDEDYILAGTAVREMEKKLSRRKKGNADADQGMCAKQHQNVLKMTKAMNAEEARRSYRNFLLPESGWKSKMLALSSFPTELIKCTQFPHFEAIEVRTIGKVGGEKETGTTGKRWDSSINQDCQIGIVGGYVWLAFLAPFSSVALLAVFPAKLNWKLKKLKKATNGRRSHSCIMIHSPVTFEQKGKLLRSHLATLNSKVRS